MSKTILIFGKTGQLSSNLINQLIQTDAVTITIGRNDIDFAEPEKLAIFLKKLTSAPDMVINATAYTAVDKAESEEDIANRVNNISVGMLANYCLSHDIPLIHFSTDYVFNGKGEFEFTEDNTSDLFPLNAYGRTKLAGENSIIASGCKYLIFRTSWVYNHSGANFVKTMLRLGKEHEQLRIVDDQIGTPNYAPDLAECTIKIINQLSGFESFPSGVYHMVADENISWAGFASKIFAAARVYEHNLVIKDIIPIKTVEYSTPAKRPLNSRLSNDKIKQTFGVSFPALDDSLHRCLKNIYPVTAQ